MENFTPYSALIGGAMIGLSVALLLVMNGRLAGVSGIMDGAFGHPGSERIWRIVFLVGLIIGAVILQLGFPEPFTPREGYPVWLVAAGGFLVGIGTRMGSGCTSGHGICGLARLSPRSLIATPLFMLTGGITVYVTHHLLGILL